METITVSSGEIEALAKTIFDALAGAGSTNGHGVCACAVVIGRLMAPRTTSMEEDMKFMQDVIEWVGLYLSSYDGEVH